MAKDAKKILGKVESMKSKYGSAKFQIVSSNSSAGSNNTGLSNIESNKDLLTKLKKLQTELGDEKEPNSSFSWKDINAEG